MRRLLIGAVLAASIAGTASAQTLPEASMATPAAPRPALFSQADVDAELEAAKAWLQLALVDYESARFMRVQVALFSPNRRNPREVVLVVCGLVNGRNRMGGYTGFQPFWFGSGLPAWRQAGLSGQANDICGPANRLSTTDYSARVGSGSTRGLSQ